MEKRIELNDLRPDERNVDGAADAVRGGGNLPTETVSFNFEEIKSTSRASNNLRQIGLAAHSYGD